LQERDKKLAEAQKAQADLVRKERELDDARREMDLTIEKRVTASLSSVRDKAKLEAEEGLKLRVAEKEEQIASMQRWTADAYSSVSETRRIIEIFSGGCGRRTAGRVRPAEGRHQQMCLAVYLLPRATRP
jgi:hypothetical protein